MGTPNQSMNTDSGNGDGFKLVTRRRLAHEFKTRSHDDVGPFDTSSGRSSSFKARTHSIGNPVKSTGTHESPTLPSPSSGPTTGPSNASAPNVAAENAPAKKSKKKKESKEARLRRREEERFKAIYGPKDSRIQVMSPAVFSRLQGNQQASSHPVVRAVQQNTRIDSPMPATTSDNGRVSFPEPQWGKTLNFLSPDMKSEFPELGADPSRPSKPIQLSPESLATPSTSANANSIAASKSKSESEPGLNASVATPSNDPSFSNAVKTENVGTSTTLTPTTDLNLNSNSPSPSKPETPKTNKKKPSKAPLIVNLEALLSAKKDAATPKRSTQALAKAARKSARISINEKTLQPAGNILDSSGIKVMHRGKMRETPKKKKPSRLKRAILLSRQLRKQLTISENLNRKNSGVGDQESVADLQGLSKLTLNLSLENSPTAATVNLPVTNANDPYLSLVKHEPGSKISRSQSPPEDIHQEIVSQGKKKSPEIEIKQEQSFDDDSDSECKLATAAVVLQPDYFHNLVEGAIATAIKPDPEPSEPQPASEEVKSMNLSPEMIEAVKAQMHNRKFRKYCDMYTSKELHGLVISLLKQLHHFQDKLYKTDKLKYKLKKRYVHGTREIMNFMSINKVQMIILAPDIESNKNVKGGLDDVLESMLATAKSKNVPVVFSGNRYVLGIPIKIKTPISAIGILDHQGAEDPYRKVLDTAAQLRLNYQTEFVNIVQALALTPTSTSTTAATEVASKE